MTEHYISTVLAFLVGVKQRRGPKMRARPADHTLPRLPEVYRMPDTSVFQTRCAVVVLASVLTNDI